MNFKVLNHESIALPSMKLYQSRHSYHLRALPPLNAGKGNQEAQVASTYGIAPIRRAPVRSCTYR